MGADRHVQQQIDRLFDRFERLTDNELILLRAIWEEQESLPRELAWRNAARVIREAQRESMLNDARGRLGAWINNYLTATALEYGNFLISKSGLDAGKVRQAALPPMLDAVAATLAADRISSAEHAVLMEPLSALASDNGVEGWVPA